MPEVSHWHNPSREKACIICGRSLPLSDFSAYGYITKQGKESTRYESRCKPCSRERRKQRYTDPVKGAMDRATSLNWKDRNRDKVAEYTQHRQKHDPAFRAMKATAQRRRKARQRAGTSLEDCDSIKMIYEQAMALQRITGIEYHVDHMVPLSLGGKHEPGNLQIITAVKNMKKGARPIWP